MHGMSCGYFMIVCLQRHCLSLSNDHTELVQGCHRQSDVLNEQMKCSAPIFISNSSLGTSCKKIGKNYKKITQNLTKQIQIKLNEISFKCFFSYFFIRNFTPRCFRRWKTRGHNFPRCRASRTWTAWGANDFRLTRHLAAFWPSKRSWKAVH